MIGEAFKLETIPSELYCDLIEVIDFCLQLADILD